MISKRAILHNVCVSQIYPQSCSFFGKKSPTSGFDFFLFFFALHAFSSPLWSKVLSYESNNNLGWYSQVGVRQNLRKLNPFQKDVMTFATFLSTRMCLWHKAIYRNNVTKLLVSSANSSDPTPTSYIVPLFNVVLTPCLLNLRTCKISYSNYYFLL